MKKKFPHPWPRCKPVLIALIRPLGPHCYWTLWCYSGVPRMSSLLKISLDIESDFRNGFFRTLHIDLEVESNFQDQYWQSCTRMHLMLQPGSVMRDGSPLIPQEGVNCAMGHENIVKIATPPCSPYEVWDEITYPFQNFNDTTVEVWEWINNFIPHFSGHVFTYPCWD